MITFVWPDADVSPLTVERLDKLASGVPYLGRSTSPATLSFDDEWKGEPWPAWIPVDLGAGGVSLPVPYAGFVDELDAAYADGRRAWETYRTQDYRFAGGPDEPEETRSDFESPYSAPMVLRFRREQYLAGSSLGILTTALRRAVMSLVPDPLPPAISGHGADGTPHAAYLGLVDVGHRYSDGHVLALGVTGPRNDPRTLELLGQAVLGDPGLRLLRVAQLGDFDLKYDPALARPLGATAQRWVSAARTWTSATPVVLDRHPRGRLTEIDVVTESIVVAGYPSPAAVELSHAPLTPGALLLRRHQVPLRSGDRRPVRHIKITFDRPVRGPVLVGALRHLGFGLFVPSERSPGWKGPR